LGIPYELLMKDFTVGSYSSIRAAFMSAWKTASQVQEWLKTQWLDVAYVMWLEEAIAKGTVEADGFFDRRGPWIGCSWRTDGKGWLDPVREAQAVNLRISTLVSTLKDECADQGKDWRKVVDQRATEIEYMAQKNVTLADINQTIAVAPSNPRDEDEKP
jgi:capsid protein